jgi:cancer susceptibility candidate protein 1
MRPVKNTNDTLIHSPYPATGTIAEPVQVKYFLPKTVFIHPDDTHTVGVWDDEKQEWSTEYVSDLEYSPDECKLEFSLTKFAPVAYLQQKTTDYPYDSWYIRSTGD